MKMNNFQGDTYDLSAKIEALPVNSFLNVLGFFDPVDIFV